MGENYLTLKWGGLKSWNFEGNEEAAELLGQFYKEGVCMSAACQKNTLKQKEIICKLIDLMPGETIYLDWDGEDVSKEDAKKYVMEYK